MNPICKPCEIITKVRMINVVLGMVIPSYLLKQQDAIITLKHQLDNLCLVV